MNPRSFALVGLLSIVAIVAWLAGARGGGTVWFTREADQNSRAQAADDEVRQERLALGHQSFQENCLMCHSEELTSGQRLTAQQWMAEVEKMIGWGAPVPQEQKKLLIDYLASRYADSVPGARSESVTPDQAIASILPQISQRERESGNPERGAALYAANCATCHGPDALGGDLGTNLVEKPVLLRPAEYTQVVRQGMRRMPGFAAALTAAQELDILAWLRAQRYGLSKP